MNFEFSEEDKSFRKEVIHFAESELLPHWNEEAVCWPGGYGTMPIFDAKYKEFCDDFLGKLGSRGWLSLSWPRVYGGRGSMMKHGIVQDVLGYFMAPNGNAATLMVAPTILKFGSDKMKEEWLSRIALGKHQFWMGYSEPNAGSDVRNVYTRAVKEGDHYIVNGEKVWASGAHLSDHAWLLVRTGEKDSGHQGLSLLIVDNHSEGITIRPVKNICGIYSFDEVFFNDVRVPQENLVGEEGKGFYYIMNALQYERVILSIGGFRRVMDELINFAKTKVLYGKPLSKHTIIRNKIAEMAIEVETLYGLYWRSIWQIDKGELSEVLLSALKLFSTELGQKIAGAGMEILGLYGQLERGSKWAPLRGWLSLGYLDSVSGPIGAGTSEIQRNIIATRGLGLPLH